MEDCRTAFGNEPFVREAFLAKYFLKIGDREVEVELEKDGDDVRVKLDGAWHEFNLRRIGDSRRYAFAVDGRTIDVVARETVAGFDIQIEGTNFGVGTQRSARRRRGGRDQDDADHFEDGKWTLTAPMTGAIVEVRVETGDLVDAGTVLMIVEAMKMQNELRSRVAGRVQTIRARKGARVETGSPLVEIEAIPAAAPESQPP